ncbi:MAG: hypothetical protein ACKV0T_28180 [Planctomycetales bacterium]
MPASLRVPGSHNPRRDRRRVTWLLFLLGLVIIGISEASKPRNWEWLTGAGRSKEIAVKDSDRPKASAVSRAEPLDPGEFRLVPGDPAPEVERAELAESPNGTAGWEDSSPSFDPRLPPALFAGVRDESLGIRSAEREAYFGVLSKSREAPPQALQQAGRRDVSYAELMNEPERYRGELVSLRGELRRLLPLPAGENDQGFDQLFDGWLFTDDAGRKSPYRLILLSRPDQFPEGEAIRERVEFTGYFFKRCAYETSQGLHAAPLLIGKQLQWQPPRIKTAAERQGGATGIVAGLSLLAVCFAGALWWLSAGDRRFQLAHKARVQVSAAEAIAGLAGVETKDASQFLRELAIDADRPPPGPAAADLEARARAPD